MKYQTLPWIAGNPLSLQIPLQKVTITAGGHETTDYEPQEGDVVTITLRSQRSEKTYTPQIEGNIATITDNGTLLIGEYAVETLVVESDGTKRRSYYPFVLNVMKATPEMLAYFDDFPEYANGVLLDTPSIFFAVGAGTIDAYTKAESDARFVNKVELTAYSTTQQMLAAIASALNGYATQQYVDGKVQDEATRATGAEQALQNSIGLKQDIINDLASIREGAALGATAVQPSALSGYESKVAIESASGATLNAQVGKYYTLTNVGTLVVTLPTITAGTTTIQTVTFYIAAGSSPDVTFTSTHSIYYSDGFEIAASSTYEVSAVYNGIAWVVASVKIVIPT